MIGEIEGEFGCASIDVVSVRQKVTVAYKR